MATETKDVLKLFTTEAAFLGASKQRQMGIDKTTKRILVHNNTDDTLAIGVSDDSLQALLAKANVFTANQRISSTNEMQFGDGNSKMWDDGDDFKLNSDQSIIFSIDSDNDSGTEKFSLTYHNGTEIFYVREDGTMQFNYDLLSTYDADVIFQSGSAGVASVQLKGQGNVGGKLAFDSNTLAMSLTSLGSMSFDIDSDDGSTTDTFSITHNNGTELFRVKEDGTMLLDFSASSGDNAVFTIQSGLTGDATFTLQGNGASAFGYLTLDSNTSIMRLYNSSGQMILGPAAGTRLTFDTDDMTAVGTIITEASATGKAGLNVPHGTAPSSPSNGDMWTTTAGLYVRINGSTVGPLS